MYFALDGPVFSDVVIAGFGVHKVQCNSIVRKNIPQCSKLILTEGTKLHR